MIENTKLTLDLLRHFARDDVSYPSNLKITHLYAAFPDQDQADIDYSVICAIQSGLLDGNILDASSPGNRKLIISYMDGLSQTGGEYVRHAESNYERAVSEIQKKGIEVSTDILSAYVRKLVFAALGLD